MMRTMQIIGTGMSRARIIHSLLVALLVLTVLAGHSFAQSQQTQQPASPTAADTAIPVPAAPAPSSSTSPVPNVSASALPLRLAEVIHPDYHHLGTPQAPQHFP